VAVRRALRSFEAWDDGFGMTVVVGAGACLHVRGIRFNCKLGGGQPPLARAVEFETGGARYFCALDRFHDNTAPERA
jgi:hypothetical protein